MREYRTWDRLRTDSGLTCSGAFGCDFGGNLPGNLHGDLPGDFRDIR